MSADEGARLLAEALRKNRYLSKDVRAVVETELLGPKQRGKSSGAPTGKQ